MKFKVLKFIIIPIIIALLAVNFAWIMHVRSFNKFFDEKFEHLHGNTSHIDRTGDVLYGAYTPEYLRFHGNFSCNSKDGTFKILLWPTFMCRDIKRIGMILQDSKGSAHHVYVDKNLNYSADLNEGITQEEYEIVRAIMAEKQTEIAELYSMMRERFNFEW